MKKLITALCTVFLIQAHAVNLDQLVQLQKVNHQKSIYFLKLNLIKKWKTLATFQDLLKTLEDEIPSERAKKYKEIFNSVRQENLPEMKLRGDVFTLTKRGKISVSLWIDPISNTFKVNNQEIVVNQGNSFEDILKQLELMNLVVYQKSSFIIDEAHAALLSGLVVAGVLLAVGDLIASAISKGSCRARFMKFKQENVTSLTTCRMEMGLIRSGQLSKAQSETYRLLLKVLSSADEPISCLNTVKSSFKSFNWFRFKTCVEKDKATIACNGLEDLSECLKDFENFEPQVVSETLFSMEHEDAPYVKNDPRLKDVFTSYSACYGLDWRILKGIAKAESGLNPSVGCDKKYAGLFQVSKAYCRGGSSKYSYISKDDCETKRCDVEVNTAIASYHLDKNFKRIQRECPNASLEEVILLSYVGHNNGPAVLSHVLARGGCKKEDQAKAVRSFYDERGGSFRGVDADWGERKWKYGQKIANTVKSLGVTRLRVPINSELCPMTYGGLENVPNSLFLDGRRHAAPAINFGPLNRIEDGSSTGSEQ